jgi:hypothetical protein
VEAREVVGQRRHRFRHRSPSLIVHTEALHHGLRVGHKVLNLFLRALRGSAEIINPTLRACRLAAEYRLELRLRLLGIRGSADGCACKVLNKVDTFFDDSQSGKGLY